MTALGLGFAENAAMARQLDLLASRPSGAQSLVDQLAAFTFNGARTVVERRGGVDFLFNEFWTARQRQAIGCTKSPTAPVSSRNCRSSSSSG